MDKSHSLGIAAIEHFLDDLVIILRVITWMGFFELGPVITKDPLEGGLINTFHVYPWTALRTTIVFLGQPF
ncbi:MAG TPA: hypothetical protein VMW24_18685, partial [Sedimentisphaerales bacterium]|nr:hypothetical protein [Sedimentisphaerales bacterium]